MLAKETRASQAIATLSTPSLLGNGVEKVLKRSSVESQTPLRIGLGSHRKDPRSAIL
jgi:hypothetical protein